jgi:anti-anti-sigma regulatory factor
MTTTETISTGANSLTLSYPKRQSIAFSNNLFDLYRRAQATTAKEIFFDLTRTEYFTPFGIIMLTATVAKCLKRGVKCRYRAPEKPKARKFFREVGFNNYFKLLDGAHTEPHNIRTGDIQLVRLKGLNTQIADDITEILNYHLRISEELKGSLRLSISEAITNVIDHSGVDEYYVCCWNYPSLKKIKLCIADLGIGIRSSLTKKTEYSYITSDDKAILKAIENGVSSRPGKAGLGLDHIRRFLKVNKGQLCIISGARESILEV